MSIIANTLHRLQTQTKDEGSARPKNPSVVLPARGKREPGWHTRPSRVKLWLAGFGLMIGLSSVGLMAYWSGFSWDFSKATYASPGTPPSYASSVSSLTPETSSSNFPAFEPQPEATAHSFQDVLPSASPYSEEDSSILQVQDSPEISLPQNSDHSLFELPVIETSGSSVETAQLFSSARPQIHPEPIPTHIPAVKSAAAYRPTEEPPEQELASTDLSAASLAPLGSPDLQIDQLKEWPSIKNTIPGEIVGTGVGRADISGSAQQSFNDTTSLQTSTAKIPVAKEHLQTAQASNPVQLSPTDRLRQAQHFIQSGKYEEAASLLSPLFHNLPDHWEPWFWMGTALLGQNHLEQADQFFLNGLARNDKIPQLWIQHALVAHQRGEYQLAIHELRRAESLDAGLPHTYLNLGYSYEHLGNDQLANENYAKFLRVSEGNPAFFSTRKKIYARFTEIHSTPNSKLSSSLPEIP